MKIERWDGINGVKTVKIADLPEATQKEIRDGANTVHYTRPGTGYLIGGKDIDVTVKVYRR